MNSSIQTSATRVLQKCLENEYNRADCALCQKPFKGSESSPVIVPCEGIHVAHHDCWHELMKIVGGSQSEMVIRCLHCERDVDRH